LTTSVLASKVPLSPTMRRIAIFAHYDPDARIRGYVLHHIAALREVCAEIHFLSTAGLGDGELAKLDGLVTTRRLCENVGYDFGMWAQALASRGLGDIDELVLTNSSVLGPLVPMARVFERMAPSRCDFWSVTDNVEYEYHLQSYFVVLRQAPLRGGQVERFFESVLPYRNKTQVIRSYEVGLTHFLLDQGFAPDVLASVYDPGIGLGSFNASLFAPLALLDHGVPYVKVELLRDNPHQISLAGVRARMAAAGYPLDLVEPDWRPPQPLLRGPINRLRYRLRHRQRASKAAIPLRPPILAMLEARRAR
jgi:O-antigen biosynthesis protein